MAETVANVASRSVDEMARRFHARPRRQGSTCLWFNAEAEEAASFDTGIFKDARLGRVHRHTGAGPCVAG